ncbi:hypothetical protein [Bacillus sp. J37]|uniref:hypothetical protein n=1 Tax=Bacillus sp. J37 TaxID=935837 RepID=UPI00047E4D56|nr:hypothetical protein [Bacillus sp. J37]
MKSGHINQYTNLSQFNCLKDFNNNIEQWMIDIKDQFTKGELIGLKRLIRYSAKLPGVCNAKIQTLVSATHENEIGGISRSTFKRMLSKAKELGLLVVHNTYKNGKQAHSVYVFNRYVSNAEQASSFLNHIEPPKEEKLNQQINYPSFETSNISNKRNNDSNYAMWHKLSMISATLGIDASFTSNSVPKEFTSLAATYYSCPKTIEELYLVVKQVTRYYLHYTEQDKLELAIECFKQLIRNIKLGKRKVHNLFGYFNGIVNGVLDQRYFGELFEEVG